MNLNTTPLPTLAGSGRFRADHRTWLGVGPPSVAGDDYSSCTLVVNSCLSIVNSSGDAGEPVRFSASFHGCRLASSSSSFGHQTIPFSDFPANPRVKGVSIGGTHRAGAGLSCRPERVTDTNFAARSRGRGTVPSDHLPITHRVDTDRGSGTGGRGPVPCAVHQAHERLGE